jgi:hypothetical protein
MNLSDLIVLALLAAPIASVVALLRLDPASVAAIFAPRVG